MDRTQQLRDAALAKTAEATRLLRRAEIEGRSDDTEEVIRLMDANPLLDGLTLSGGEPFEQAAACLALARAARERGLSVWAYTGYTLEALRQRGDADIDELLGLCDVLVDGPFVLAQRSLELDFRGSANQRLIDLNATREAGELRLWQRFR